MNRQLKQSIAEGKHIFGTFMTTDSVKNAEILGAAGLDYVMRSTANTEQWTWKLRERWFPRSKHPAPLH